MRAAPFASDYALLDVKRGRAALQRRVAKTLKTGKPVRIRVEMTVDYPYGRDDGTSIEFCCTVTSVKEFAS